MSILETFNEFFDDTMNKKMSVHAFGMYAKGYIINLEVKIEELEFNASEHQRLEEELNQILHPNGGAPEKPSFCDLVSYVQYDLKGKEGVKMLPTKDQS